MQEDKISKIERVWWKIQKLPRETYYLIKNFPRRIYRSILWFFRMYMNEEWDQAYMLQVWIWKLKDMQKLWSNRKHIHVIEESRLRNLTDITEAIRLLEKLLEDEYNYNEDWDNFNKKWGNIVFTPLKDCSKFLTMSRENRKTIEDEKRYNDEFNTLMLIADQKKKDDQNKLFTLLKERYEYWWD